MELKDGTTILFKVSEEAWRQPFTMKRHHVYDTRTVILRGTLISSTRNEFKVELKDNNGFDKDGGTYVFSRGNILCEQNLEYPHEFGKWSAWSDNYTGTLI